VSARPTAAPEFEDESSILEILNVLLKRWPVVIGLPLVVVIAVLGISFLMPPIYTATTSFVPEMRSEGGVPAGLGALAGQLGISFGGEASQSPRFYAEVSKSRGILDRLLLSRYVDPRAGHLVGDTVTLLTILQSAGRKGVDSLERGARKLAGLIAVGVDAQTNIVTLKVQSQYPDLAAAVANRLVAYLNDFNTLSRQSQARERRKFTEQRVAAGEQELRDAEEALKRFYQANRSWQQAPQLVFEEGQLRRQVDLRQELYRTLRREYETARIQEVNDTPVITVIDAAVVPQRKSGPTRRLWVLAAFVVSGVFAVFLAFSAEYLARARREQDGPYSNLLSTARQVRNELTRTVRAVLRQSTKETRQGP
jgi:tyrosine-protein kinase Etk/Wzc